MSEHRTRLALATGLLATAALAISASSAHGSVMTSATRAAVLSKETAPAVSGRARADGIYKMGLCSTACINFKWTKLGETPDGHDLSAPDYYPMTVNKDLSFSSTGAAETGSYRIAVYGSRFKYDGRALLGYLKKTSYGYTAVRSFADADQFAVSDTPLHLGLVSFTGAFQPTLYVYQNRVLRNLGGEAIAKLYMRSIPKGARIVVSSMGCGKVQTRQLVRKTGNFTYQWVDRYAYRHYKKSLALRVSASKAGLTKTFPLIPWTVKSFGWHCLRAPARIPPSPLP